MKELLTRDEAVQLVGLIAIEAVESLNCEPTNCLVDGDCEWSASHKTPGDGTTTRVTIYYHTTAADDQLVADADGDAGVIDWSNRIGGYTVDQY